MLMVLAYLMAQNIYVHLNTHFNSLVMTTANNVISCQKAILFQSSAPQAK